MEMDFETTFNGLFITSLVCIVSGVLYYMFKRAAFVSPVSFMTNQEMFGRKKGKRSDQKKSKKMKKNKHDDRKSYEHEADKTQTSDDTADDEDDQHVEDTNANLLEREAHNYPLKASCEILNRVETVGQDSSHILCESHCATLETMNLDRNSSRRSSPDQNPGSTSGASSDYITTKMSIDKSDPLQPVYLRTNNVTEGDVSYPPVSSELQVVGKLKKVKRRSNKKHLYEVIKVSDTAEEVSRSGLCTSPNTRRKNQQLLTDSTESALVSELKGTINLLEEQLKVGQKKMTEVNDSVSRLTAENERLFSKEEETRLGLRVLQGQYTELLRTNKTIEHDRNLKDRKLKEIETENCELHKRLEQVQADMTVLKNESEVELHKLREQLAESKTKMNAMATAMANATPAPTSELLHAQELAQAMSSDNCRLKSRLEQLENELAQLRQTSMRQQQDIQAFRSENRKLHADKESALDELRIQRQAEQAETKSRLASYEAQLQHRCHELDLEKQRSQEFAKTLSEVRAELARSLEREKRQSGIIESLEYQFAELSVQKQRLLEEAAQDKLVSATNSSELRAQIVNLNNELARVTSEITNTRQRANELTKELELARQEQSKEQLEHQAVLVKLDAVVDTTDIPEFHQCTSTNVKSSTAEKEKLLEEMRSQLSVTKKDLKKAKRDAEHSRQLHQASLTEIEHYKNTLIQTEELLAKLQNFVEEAEHKWQTLLKESELEREKLTNELAQSRIVNKEIELKLTETQERLTSVMNEMNQAAKTKTTLDNFGSLCSLGKCDPPQVASDGLFHVDPKSVSGATWSTDMKNLQEPNIDLDDFDTVLVDDTELHIPDDIWDSTSKVSESLPADKPDALNEMH